jgi:golgi apyrase
LSTGISTFAQSPALVANHLAPLLEHARSHIPPSLHAQTPIFLLATAGMRLLPEPQQKAVMDAACNYLRFNSLFRLDTHDISSPCGSSVRIITGEEEGLFGWISVNYLMDGFGRHTESHRALRLRSPSNRNGTLSSQAKAVLST